LVLNFARPKLIGNAPCIGRSVPFKDNSPKMQQSFRIWLVSCSDAAKIPKAIGRSKQAPSFLISEGARLMVILP